MCGVQSREGLRAIDRDIDTGNSHDKGVPNDGSGTKGGKEFHRRIRSGRGAVGLHAGYFEAGFTSRGAVVVVVIRVSRRFRVSGSSNSLW